MGADHPFDLGLNGEGRCEVCGGDRSAHTSEHVWPVVEPLVLPGQKFSFAEPPTRPVRSAATGGDPK